MLLGLPGHRPGRGRLLRADAGRGRAGRPTTPRSRPGRRSTSTRWTASCATGCRPTWCRPTSSGSTVMPMLPSDKADRKNLPAPARTAPDRRAGSARRRGRQPPSNGPLAERRRRAARPGPGLGRRQLLRRSRDELAADGPAVRAAAGAARAAAGGHARTSTRTRRSRAGWRRCWPATARPAPRRRRAARRPHGLDRRGRWRCRAAAGRRSGWPGCSWPRSCWSLGLRLAAGRHRAARRLPARGRVRQRRCSSVLTAAAGGGEVAADRALEAHRDPRSGAWRYVRFWLVKSLLRISPLARSAAPRCTWLYLRLLGREDRPRGRGVHRATPGVHRPAAHRRGRGGAQGRAAAPATGPSPAGSAPAGSTSGATRWSARARCWTSTPRLGDGAQLGHASALHRGQACRPGNAGTARRPSRPAPTSPVSTPRRCGTGRRVGVRGCSSWPCCCSGPPRWSRPRCSCWPRSATGR